MSVEKDIEPGACRVVRGDLFFVLDEVETILNYLLSKETDKTLELPEGWFVIEDIYFEKTLEVYGPSCKISIERIEIRVESDNFDGFLIKFAVDDAYEEDRYFIESFVSKDGVVEHVRSYALADDDGFKYRILKNTISASKISWILREKLRKPGDNLKFIFFE